MVAIDLTPATVRSFRVGWVRFFELACATLCGAVINGICAVVLIFFASGKDVIALRNIQSEVASLEQQTQQLAESRQQLRRAREQKVMQAAQRWLVPTVLDLVSAGFGTGMSLSKLHVTFTEAILEGGAKDAHAIAKFLESMTYRCPSIQAVVERVRTVMISDYPVESFSARLNFSLESQGASWCRQGVPDAG